MGQKKTLVLEIVNLSEDFQVLRSTFTLASIMIGTSSTLQGCTIGQEKLGMSAHEELLEKDSSGLEGALQVSP